MIFWEYDDKTSREESGISKRGKNTPHGSLIITGTINIVKLTHRVCFWGEFSKKE